MRYKKFVLLMGVGLLAGAMSAHAAQPPQEPMQFGAGNSPGWALMSPEERTEHREKMMGFKNYEDCSSYLAEHHAKMLERAREKGTTLPTEPRQGFCHRLPKTESN